MSAKRAAKTSSVKKAAKTYSVRMGGTEMWCPQCEDMTICAAIPIADQRVRSIDESDLHWFRRERQCQECFHDFITAEIEEKIIDELCEMRSALVDIRMQFDGFHKAARMAGAAIQKVEDILEKTP